MEVLGKEKACHTCADQIKFIVKIFGRCRDLCQIMTGALKDNSGSSLLVFYTASNVIDGSVFLTFKNRPAF